MSKWWITGLALLIFAAVGCDVVATVITPRGVDALDDNARDDSRLHGRVQLRQVDPGESESPDPSKSSDHTLIPIVASESENRAGPNGDSASEQGSDSTLVSNDIASAAVRYQTKPILVVPDESTPQFSDAALTIKPKPDVEESMTGEAPLAGPSVAGGAYVPTSEPHEDCIRSGGMTLWLDPPRGEWTVPVGQSIEVNLCLSNLSVDLAGFDLTLNLGRGGVAEFTGVTIGGFGLKSHSELPTESLRVRAIDLKQQLNAGIPGISLATLWIAGTGAGESPLTIEINAIDDKDGYSVTAQVSRASLQVTEG